jgi:hypothetical protein
VSDVQALQTAADRFTSGVIQKRLDYWTLRLGPSFSKRERAAMNLSRFYAVNQAEYCRNFIFKRHFPIHKIFERSCELGLWRLTANKISEIFGSRITKKFKGKLNTTLQEVEHGHHIFRAYWKNAFIKQYEKFSTFLRNEVCSNNLTDFRLKKGLSHLEAVRRSRGGTAEVPCGHRPVRRLPGKVPQRSRRLPASATSGPAHHRRDREVSRRQNPRRLMEVLLHGGTTVGGWRAKDVHAAVLTSFGITANRYGLNQLRYDLRKLKAHALLERDGKRYAYRLSEKGTRVALMFVLFHKQLCGPLANSLFHHQPDAASRPKSKLETAFHKADASIQNIIQLLEAA